jgi:hypothetical protein
LLVNKKLIKEFGNDDVDVARYSSLIKSLLYLNTTRPDIMYVSGLLSQFMHRPSRTYIGVAKEVLRYIQGTKDLVSYMKEMKWKIWSCLIFVIAIGSEIWIT